MVPVVVVVGGWRQVSGDDGGFGSVSDPVLGSRVRCIPPILGDRQAMKSCVRDGRVGIASPVVVAYGSRPGRATMVRV